MQSSNVEKTDEYIRQIARLAYIWAWPMVNIRSRFEAFEAVPEPGLMGGVMPVAPHNRIAMLHDYVTPDQKYVACPNQDVVYGFGIMDAGAEPAVVQVPEFGSRFWVYQLGDQRTDGFAELGSVYGTGSGFYLIASNDWDGEVPDGIVDVFRCPTRVGYVIPRVFMDDTDQDRQAIQSLVNQVMVYPLSEFTGEMKTRDWSAAPKFPAVTHEGPSEMQWVKPETFFDELPKILDDVPPMDGEEAIYSLAETLLEDADDERVKNLLREVAAEAESDLIAPLLNFDHVGAPVGHGWTRPKSTADFGLDYLGRTACARSNIFVNRVSETVYFYLESDSDGKTLDGQNAYELTFEAGNLPPVDGFWSLTVYNEHHFFHPNDLNRYSLGTKNKELVVADDGSLTLVARKNSPGAEQEANWLPIPEGKFELYLRAYSPRDEILDGDWSPPPVKLKL